MFAFPSSVIPCAHPYCCQGHEFDHHQICANKYSPTFKYQQEVLIHVKQCCHLTPSKTIQTPHICFRPSCHKFANPKFTNQGLQFCSYECKKITVICKKRNCRKIAETGMDYCIDHATMDDVDPRIALVGGFYHNPFPKDPRCKSNRQVRDLYS